MALGCWYQGDGDGERLGTMASNERQIQEISSMNRSAVERRTPRASDNFWLSEVYELDAVLMRRA